MVDERGDGSFHFAFEEVVFEQDAVLQGLVPALDLALRLRMELRAANVMNDVSVVRTFGTAGCVN